MDLEVTKLELIEMLLTTENVSVLKKVKDLLLEVHDKNDEGKVDYDMIDKRRQAHLNEESASYSWDEVKEKVRAAKL